MLWRLGQFQFDFPRHPIVMGILNVTPDSFSDGGLYCDPERAVDRAWTMVEEGAEIIDLGGESTRPGAKPITPEEELRRILPVLERLVPRFPIPISVDTSKPEVAESAIRSGASLINDVGAVTQVPRMWQSIAGARAGYVVMHMQGTPLTMQLAPSYRDVVREVGEFFTDRLSRLESSGIDPSQVALDPGIGFGKTVEQNLQLLTHLNVYSQLLRPLLIGISRKSFLGEIAGGGPSNRLPAALGCSLRAADQGCSIFRTHDVRETSQAFRMWSALRQPARSESSVGQTG